MDSTAAPQSRTAGNVLIALAILLWTGAWARVLYTHITAPSPAHFTEFYTADGPIDPPSWPHCDGTRLIVGAQVWQHCQQSNAAPAGFVRFDLSAGRADQLWPMEGAYWGRLLGAARTPDGDFIVAGDNEDGVDRRLATRLVRLRRGGGVEAMGALPYNLLALRVEGDHLEAVTAAGPLAPEQHRRPLAGGEWVTTSLPELPTRPRIHSDPYRTEAIDAASHSAQGWTLWGIRQGTGGTTAELWRCPPGGTWTLESVNVNGFSEDRSRSAWLDRTADGAITASYHADQKQALTRNAANLWLPVEMRPPIPAPPFLGNDSDLRFTAAGIERLWRWRGVGGEYTRVGSRWLGLIPKNGDIHAIDAERPTRLGAPLAHDSWLSNGATFIPKEAGYTVLGTFGTYVELDADLNRTDHRGLFARIAAHFANFRRLAWYNDTWLNNAPLKMATLPVVLLGLPLLLLPGLIRRRRPSPRAAALWLILALSFAWHFWYFTAPRWF